MANRNIGTEILKCIDEIKRFKKGEKKLKMSQATFAAMLVVSKRTLQDWEQGRRLPICHHAVNEEYHHEDDTQ